MMEGLRQFLHSWMGKLLLILCLSPLAFVGIETYFSTQINPNEVVKVGDVSIDLATYQNTLNNRRQMLVEQVGDASLINEKVLQEQVLQGLIDRALIENQINKLGLTVSDATITDMLSKEPAFLDANGQFSNDLFGNYLRSQGMNKDQLFDRLRLQLSLSQLNSNIINTAIYPMSAINQMIDLQTEQRPLWIARLDLKNFLPNIQVSDKEIQDYYQKHQQHLKRPETADVTYIELVKSQLNVPAPTEEEIQQQYQAHIKTLNNSQNAEYAMILINNDKAQATLADLKKQLDSNQADFATLAKQYSEDDGSKNDGGKIGSISQAMFPKDFDKVSSAISQLQVGEVTAPIQTQYGYHIFKLIKKDSPALPSIESLKDSLIKQINTQKRDNMYQDLINKINNDAVNGATITEIANQENLTAKTIKAYPKQNNQTAIRQPAIVNAVFDETALQDNSVSVGIELADSVVWVQSSNYKPVANMTLAEATPQIREQVAEEKAKALAVAEAKTIASQVQQANSVTNSKVTFENLGKVNRQAPILSAEERSVAFSQPTNGDKLAVMTTEPTAEGVSIVVGGAIEKTAIAQLSEEEKRLTARMVRENIGQSQLEDYLAYLRNTTKITINHKSLGQPIQQ